GTLDSRKWDTRLPLGLFSGTLDSRKWDTRLPKVGHSTPPWQPESLARLAFPAPFKRFSKEEKRSRMYARTRESIYGRLTPYALRLSGATANNSTASNQQSWLSPSLTPSLAPGSIARARFACRPEPKVACGINGCLPTALQRVPSIYSSAIF